MEKIHEILIISKMIVEITILVIISKIGVEFLEILRDI